LVSDVGFKVAVALVAMGLIGTIATVRFGHPPGLPPRPPPPEVPHQTAEQLLKSTLTSPAVWRNFLEQDAHTAGVPVPTLAEMGKVLLYRGNTARHGLSFEAPSVTVAGLTLTLERGDGDRAVLAIHNATQSDVAYRVVTSSSVGSSVCNGAAMLPFNALIVSKGETVRRTECVFRSDLTLTITIAESIELPPLSSWYVQQVSPLAIGLATRFARAHHPEVPSNCSPIVAQVVRGALEQGDLKWRDLIDFYARHRCETYQLPVSYRAFTKDGERDLPALPPAIP
jgi:hypothetical protein